MKEKTVREQNRLIELIESEGWKISALDLKEYGAHAGGKITNAEVTLTVHVDLRESEEEDVAGSPYLRD